MRLLPVLLFIAVPLTELAILIKVGEIIGVGATIALVIATAVIGVALLKRQGIAALARARETVEAGEFPVESVVDGACLLIAGAFLLTPGLLTDTAGFLLLIPALRRSLAHWLFGKLIASGKAGAAGFSRGPGGPPPHGPAGGGDIIEGEYEDIGESEPEAGRGDRPPRSRDSSPWRR